MVERMAVNRKVVGSIPTGGVYFFLLDDIDKKNIIIFNKFLNLINIYIKDKNIYYIYSSIAQMVERTAVNRKVVGSIPTGGVYFFY